PLPGNCRVVAFPQAVGARPAPAPGDFLRRLGTDVLLHLNPYALWATDVPYLTVVWDLQHPRQPYFPGGSGAGEWDDRHSHFARTLPRASWVVTGTELGKAEIQAHYGVAAERIVVLPLPTPTDALRHTPGDGCATARRHGLAERFLLYPAQFWPH